jgi:hypothetical protein
MRLAGSGRAGSGSPAFRSSGIAGAHARLLAGPRVRGAVGMRVGGADNGNRFIFAFRSHGILGSPCQTTSISSTCMKPDD